MQSSAVNAQHKPVSSAASLRLAGIQRRYSHALRGCQLLGGLWIMFQFVLLVGDLPRLFDDGLLVAILLIALTAGFALGGYWLISYLAAKVVNWYLPTYVIDGSDPTVIRVYGDVPVNHVPRIARKIKKARPNYELYLYDDCYQRFGCPLAALPSVTRNGL